MRLSIVTGQEEQAPGLFPGVCLSVECAPAQCILHTIEHVFRKRLRVVEQPFDFPRQVRQLPPAAHPRELVGITCDEDVFQTEVVHRVRL